MFLGHIYRCVISNAPSTVDILRRGQQLAANGRAGEAEACYQSVLDQNPAQFEALMLMGYLRLDQARLDDAFEFFAGAAEAAPNDPRAHTALGEAAIVGDRPDDAVEAFSAAIRLDPDNAGARNNLATVLSRLGRAEEAAAHFQKALERQPGDVRVLLNLGKCLQELDRIDEAMSVYRDVLRIDPSLFYRVSLRLTTGPSGRFWLSVDRLRSELGVD